MDIMLYLPLQELVEERHQKAWGAAEETVLFVSLDQRQLEMDILCWISADLCKG